MLQIFRKFFRKIYYADVKTLPFSMRKAFFEEITRVNHRHVKPILLVLLFAMVFLLLLDFWVFKHLHVPQPYATALQYLHTFGLIYAIIYSVVFQFILPGLSIRAKRGWLLSFLIISMLFCEVVAMHTLEVSGHIISFTIFLLTTGCIYILNAFCRTLFFLSAYLSFNLFFTCMVNHSYTSYGIWIETTIVLVLAMLTSKYTFNSYLDQFLHRQIILKNIKEIGQLNANLEAKVQERTQALTHAKEQLEMDKLRTSFFTNLCHEFRTPVNVILSARQLLELKLKKLVSPEEYKGLEYSINAISQYSYRLLRLSANLIDITRIDSGEYTLNRMNMDIVQVIKKITLEVSNYVKTHHFSLHIPDTIKEIIIAMDAEKIERAVLNLLSNAVKFTPKGEEIKIALYIQEGYVHISVRDKGIGIPENMKDKIFNRFVQVDKSLSRSSEGSGIGLAIVKAIVDLHHGRITVNSDLYSGSDFIISLPIQTLPDDETVCGYAFGGTEGLDVLRTEFSDTIT